jgi:hypothetical protein
MCVMDLRIIPTAEACAKDLALQRHFAISRGGFPDPLRLKADFRRCAGRTSLPARADSPIILVAARPGNAAGRYLGMENA